MKADAVFEGGGVKGIAFTGALEVMEANGYTWEKIAGTSAGSIVAALVSAGYSSSELFAIFRKLDYLDFLQKKGWAARIPVIGPVYQLLWKEGLYNSDPIEAFISQLLRKKGIQTFGDLPKGKLRIIASDITAGKMLILPDDLPLFRIDPLRFPIARAVRMSSSIPYFFQPTLLDQEGVPHYIVDGGLLSNFPVWLFDVSGIPRWPTIGFRLQDQSSTPETTNIRGIVSFTKALIVTMLDAHDRFYVKKAHAVRTIFIPTLGVKTTQFNLSDSMRAGLYQSGRAAGEKFLTSWNFQEYIETFRK